MRYLWQSAGNYNSKIQKNMNSEANSHMFGDFVTKGRPLPPIRHEEIDSTN